MLVLTRKQEQRIFIGDDIEIILVEVRRGRVKIGIKAPQEVPIERPEAVRGSKPGSGECSSDLESGSGRWPAGVPVGAVSAG